MQTRDHIALGSFLLDFYDDVKLQKYKRAFLFGCVEPDYNFATYLNCGGAAVRFNGHFSECASEKVEKLLLGFQKTGLRSAYDFFLLGTMLHYAADAFTAPHNDFFGKGLPKHVSYEDKLHRLFFAELAEERLRPAHDETSSLCAYFFGLHEEYLSEPRSPETDLRYIVNACSVLLSGNLRLAEKEPLLFRRRTAGKAFPKRTAAAVTGS